MPGEFQELLHSVALPPAPKWLSTVCQNSLETGFPLFDATTMAAAENVLSDVGRLVLLGNGRRGKTVFAKLLGLRFLAGDPLHRTAFYAGATDLDFAGALRQIRANNEHKSFEHLFIIDDFHDLTINAAERWANILLALPPGSARLLLVARPLAKDALEQITALPYKPTESLLEQLVLQTHARIGLAPPTDLAAAVQCLHLGSSDPHMGMVAAELEYCLHARCPVPEIRREAVYQFIAHAPPLDSIQQRNLLLRIAAINRFDSAGAPARYIESADAATLDGLMRAREVVQRSAPGYTAYWLADASQADLLLEACHWAGLLPEGNNPDEFTAVRLRELAAAPTSATAAILLRASKRLGTATARQALGDDYMALEPVLQLTSNPLTLGNLLEALPDLPPAIAELGRQAFAAAAARDFKAWLGDGLYTAAMRLVRMTRQFGLNPASALPLDGLESPRRPSLRKLMLVAAAYPEAGVAVLEAHDISAPEMLEACAGNPIRLHFMLRGLARCDRCDLAESLLECAEASGLLAKADANALGNIFQVTKAFRYRKNIQYLAGLTDEAWIRMAKSCRTADHWCALLQLAPQANASVRAVVTGQLRAASCKDLALKSTASSLSRLLVAARRFLGTPFLELENAITAMPREALQQIAISPAGELQRGFLFLAGNLAAGGPLSIALSEFMRGHWRDGWLSSPSLFEIGVLATHCLPRHVEELRALVGGVGDERLQQLLAKAEAPTATAAVWSLARIQPERRREWVAMLDLPFPEGTESVKPLDRCRLAGVRFILGDRRPRIEPRFDNANILRLLREFRGSIQYTLCLAGAFYSQDEPARRYFARRLDARRLDEVRAIVAGDYPAALTERLCAVLDQIQRQGQPTAGLSARA